MSQADAGRSAVGRYGAAAAARDMEALMQTLSPDVELRSPIMATLRFTGHADVRYLLTAVYDLVDDLRWHDEVGQEGVRILLGEGRVGRLRLTDALVFDLGGDGRIRRITPHLRPWLTLTVFALRLAPRMVRRPPVLFMAWRRGRGAPA